MHALPVFLLQAIVIVVVARALGVVARGARQPLVVAEIVAGILLGPSFLGALAPGVSATLFPASSLGVLAIVSQFGLVLFMFLVGLELDPAFLRGRGRASVLISHSSIVVPFTLGALLALYLHEGLAPPGTRWLPFALFMGVAMSITAFPVLARILTERRLLGTEIGALTIACAAIDDVTAWCLLAFVVSIAKAGGIPAALRTTILTLVYVGAMAFVVRPVLARVAARRIGRDSITQGIVAVTLVLLLVSSSLTELIGIHALFGAFAFGLVVPRTGEFARALAERTEDLVVVLLLPLFFAYSGLRTRIGLIDGVTGWLTCGVIIAVACAGKFGGSYAAARISRLPPRDAGILAVLMNTRGLMELVVLNIGLDLGVISPTLFTMMVVMALVTTVMTTPLLAILERRTHVRDVIEPSLPAIPAPFSVLVCTAYERSAEGMLAIARALARAGDRVYALRLLAPNDRSSQQIAAHGEEPRLSTLSGLVERAAESDLTVRPLSFTSTDAARDICDVASVKAADLVLLGWHRPWFGRAPLGGTVQQVLGRAEAPVGVLIDRDLREVRTAAVVVQGNADDATLLALAERLEQGGCRIVVVRDVAEQAVVTATEGTDLVIVGLEGPLSDGRLFDRVPRSLLLVRRGVTARVPARAAAERRAPLMEAST